MRLADAAARRSRSPRIPSGNASSPISSSTTNDDATRTNSSPPAPPDSTTRAIAELSPAERIQRSPDRAKILRSYSDGELEALAYDWHFWARPKQLTPIGHWLWWLLLAGRGFGKTRVGAEFIIEGAKAGLPRQHILAETGADARDVCVEGESGILTVSPPDFRPVYFPSKRKLVWPNGAIALTFSADRPDQLRGPQCFRAWCDELAKFRYDDAFDQLELGLRLGDDPRGLITTTPKPRPLIRKLADDPDVVVTRGNTFENASNLSAKWLDRIRRKLENTRLGRQELFAELFDDAAGALWRRDWIEDARVLPVDVPELLRVGVGIDPSFSDNDDACEAGIVVAGKGVDGELYVLGDYSGRMLPSDWSRRALFAHEEHEADGIIVETNMGGKSVTETIRNMDGGARVRIHGVRASRGKQVRAEPVSALYEQGRVHHVGYLGELEDQLCTWEPESGHKSPDRLDALVWIATWLSKGRPGAYNRTRRFKGSFPKWRSLT